MKEALVHDRYFGISVESEPASRTVRLCLSGELDVATVPLLLQALASTAVYDSKALVLDLSGLDFLDLAGLRAVHHGRSSHPAASVVVGTSPVRALYELVGEAGLLDELLPAAATAAPTHLPWRTQGGWLGAPA